MPFLIPFIILQSFLVFYLKDGVLIYRGLEFETLAGFTSRIRVEFPSAEVGRIFYVVIYIYYVLSV